VQAIKIIGKEDTLNQKINKINSEIEKTREKISGYQSRLKDLERQKTELVNADIVAMVRGVDIEPGDFEAFVRAYMENKGRLAPETPPSAYAEEKTEKGDRDIEE
jgi:predicted  nucleic acid-binding Zn-ribbon protein